MDSEDMVTVTTRVGSPGRTAVLRYLEQSSDWRETTHKDDGEKRYFSNDPIIERQGVSYRESMDARAKGRPRPDYIILERAEHEGVPFDEATARVRAEMKVMQAERDAASPPRPRRQRLRRPAFMLQVMALASLGALHGVDHE